MPLPSFNALEAALRKTTEFLAHELAAPGGEAPRWNEVEWRVAEAVTALQGISALLKGTLRWTGPAHWNAFLAEQQRHTLLRQRRIVELLARIDARAREQGLGMVALKGSALLQLGLYPSGERPMGDVDLLIDSRDMTAATQVLQDVGYAESFTSWRHGVFVARDTRDPVGFGEHVENPIKIELHTRIAERLPIHETDITSSLMPRRLPSGLHAYPCVADLMRHLLLHAAGNMRARALRLIQLHDIAQLAVRMDHQDWNALLGAEAQQQEIGWAWPPLTLTARYYPQSIPASVLAAVQPHCPWWLRRVSRGHLLADVSWSKIRIQAFPGIEWSKSAREAWLFAMSRLLPSREALADLSHLATAQPSLAHVPWYQQSHAVRILRWVFSRPPRVQTIFSVRSALGHEI